MPSSARSLVRSTLVLLAVAGAGFVAGALWHNPMSSREVSAAFASPAQAAHSNYRDPLRATGTAPPASTDGIGQVDGEQIPQPRECDLAKGISIECMWLD
jgi:hypothetical protein